ncbi:Hypothetical protein AAM4_1590 [Actinomyces succiniciruminis]|uniref:Uncharacterized protein n=1 Tax=Actinomyces succiniciruminis TaxID=1522002 RepID=A0A1L7RP34_9ACTO|nr:Hypothetical protein AAM4_1590 [Actinomyces succiniciruminis]
MTRWETRATRVIDRDGDDVVVSVERVPVGGGTTTFRVLTVYCDDPEHEGDRELLFLKRMVVHEPGCDAGPECSCETAAAWGYEFLAVDKPPSYPRGSRTSGPRVSILPVMRPLRSSRLRSAAVARLRPARGVWGPCRRPVRAVLSPRAADRLRHDKPILMYEVSSVPLTGGHPRTIGFGGSRRDSVKDAAGWEYDGYGSVNVVCPQCRRHARRQNSRLSVDLALESDHATVAVLDQTLAYAAAKGLPPMIPLSALVKAVGRRQPDVMPLVDAMTARAVREGKLVWMHPEMRETKFLVGFTPVDGGFHAYGSGQDRRVVLDRVVPDGEWPGLLARMRSHGRVALVVNSLRDSVPVRAAAGVEGVEVVYSLDRVLRVAQGGVGADSVAGVKEMVEEGVRQFGRLMLMRA